MHHLVRDGKKRMKRIILLMLLVSAIAYYETVNNSHTNCANVHTYVDTCHLSNLFYLQQQLKEG